MGEPVDLAKICVGCKIYAVRQDETLNKDYVLMTRLDKHYCRKCLAFVHNRPVMTMKRPISESDR
jgi:hypothetical protein